MKNKLATLLFFLGAGAALHATPDLQLTTATVGPVLVAQGSNGTINSAQQPYALNVGDGSLHLTLSSSASWLVPTLSTTTTLCAGGVPCNAVQLALQTSSLAKGTYTGFVTVSDPNALDAPQTISVTVEVGGNVPSQVTLYAPPNGTATTTFTTGTGAGATATTQSGGSWLSVAGSGFGSFQFTETFTVTASAANLAANTYNGSITIAGSSFSPDNTTIPVVLNVTTQPIAQPTSTSVQFQIAQGAAKQTFPVVLTNAGQGTLTVSGATAATSSGGTWLTATASGNVLTLTADATGLSPGPYSGTLTVNSNAVNGTTTIPVQLTVVAAGPPTVSYGGVVNVFTNSTSDLLSQGDFIAVYGSQFTTGAPQIGTLPYGTTLAGTQVLINGKAVPVEYVSASQINVQIPYNAKIGPGTLSVVSGSMQGNTVSIYISATAPAMLPYPGTSYILAQTPSGGFEGYSAAAPAKIGDVVTFYAVGFGATSPAATEGTAAPGSPSFALVTPTPSICFGEPNPITPALLCSTPSFVGLAPGYAGLYQINFTIPQNAPTGPSVPIYAQVGNAISNILSIAVQ